MKRSPRAAPVDLAALLHAAHVAEGEVEMKLNAI
jgi:hypothetical protein